MAISLLASGSGANKQTRINEIFSRSSNTFVIPENNPRTDDQDSENNGGFLGGVAYLGEKVALSALSSIEGIWDYTAGGVAKLFGADAWAERQFANDWVNYNHADEWYDPDEGWRFAGDIAGGIGSSLPAIVITGVAVAASGGALLPAAGAISGSIAGLGAAGNATKEAYRKTGKLGAKEFGYGALTGVTEGSLEAITAGIGTGTGRIVSSIAKKSAGEVTETLAKSGAKNVLKALGQDFVSEAFEEGVAEILSPVYQRMTYDPDAKNASAQEVAYAALIGGLSGALMSGANTTVNTSRNLISGNKVVSEGKAATVLENARQITERETAHETGYESFKAVSNTYKQLSDSLAGTNGEVRTVKQKMLLGQLTRENAVATFSPFIERSAENIIRNIDTFVERYNALGMKDANGNPITFTKEQILSGIDLSADRKTYVKQLRKALSSNSTLATLAVADAMGNITMDTRRFAELALEGKNLATLADYENFRQNATAEEKAAVGAALGIENFDLVKVEDFRAAVEQFAADGKMGVWAQQSMRVRTAVETAADTAKTMPHILRKNMTDGVYRYTSEDGGVNMAVFKEGAEYHIYDYDSGKISRSLTSQEVNKVLRDVRQGVVSQTSEIIRGRQYAVAENKKAAIVIEADSELAKRIESSSKSKYTVIRDYLVEKFGGQEFSLSDGRRAIMDKRDAQELSHKANSARVAQLGNLKKIVETATYSHSEEKVEHNKFSGFHYYTIDVTLGKETFPLWINVGVAKNDGTNHIYAITNKTEEAPTHYGVSRPVGNAIQNASSTDSISQNKQKSNSFSKNNSENLDTSDLDTYARENIKDYDKLSAPNQAEIRAMIREGRALGMSDGDVLLYAKISARTGVRVTFDKGKTLIGRRKGTRELVYADGFYDPATNEICVNPDGKRSADKLLIHELAHAIYGGEKGMRLAKRNAKNLSAEEKKAISDRYAEVDRTDEIELFDEYNAHYAEGILGNAETLERLLDDAPTVKDRILDFLRGAKGDTDAQRSAAARRLFFKYKRLFDKFAQQNAQNIAAERLPTATVDAEKKTPRGEAPEANGVTSTNDEKVQVSGKRLAVEDGTHKAEISSADVEILRSIGRKSINSFTSEDVKKTEKWARRFYAELGMKSPFFRAWFGDWRQHERSKTVNILGMEHREGKNPRGVYKNKDTGWDINSSSVGYDETISHGGKDKKSIIAMQNIDKIIENGILLDTEVSEYGRGKKSVYTSFMHKFYAPIKIDDKHYIAKMAVDESFAPGQNDTIKKFYHVRAIQIETASSVGIGESHTPIIEDTVSNISIADLYELVKRYDVEFSPKSVNPAMLNADGTPKMFYHGTNADFTVFDKKKAKYSGLYGKGFYFTESKSHSATYGDSMAVYLNIRNPLSPKAAAVTKDQIRKFLSAVAENEDYSIENYGTYDVEKVLSGITSRDAFSVIQDVNSTAIGDFVEAVELFNTVNGTKYDGIVVPTETVAFYPEQIKSATDNIGTFDGSNPDIRFALPEDTDTADVMAEFSKELKDQLNEEADRESEIDLARARAEDAAAKEISRVKNREAKRADYWKDKAKENESRAKVLGNISALAQRMKDLKLGTYHNATQDQSKQFAGSVEGLSKIVWNGNLSVKLARKHIGTLRAWYKQDNPILCYQDKENPGYYNAEIAEMLARIADGEGGFSVADLRAIRDLMQYFIKLDETYNKVFKNGKWIDAEPEAKRYIGTINANKELKVGFLAQRGCQIYMETFSEPLTVAQRMDYYAKGGFYTETLLSLREAAVNADVAEMEIKADYDDFMQRNKKYLAKATEETVTYRGTAIPRMQLISLYMTFKRKQAQAGLVINGFSFRDKNGDTVRVPGTHPEFGQKRDLTQKDITGAAEAEIVSIEKLLTGTDKEYIGILEKAFNEDARKLKADTDIHRLGYTNAHLDYYYPIRRGDIAKNIDASTYFDEMDRVSNASYNKDTVRGARQKLFIESADSVFNRHVHSVCLYANLSPVIDTYNRLYNLDVSGNSGDPNSVKTASENVWKNGSRYIAKLVADIQGIPASSAEGQKILGFIRSGYAQYQLGANPKTWASQLSSIFASLSLLDADAITRGIGISSEGIDEYCPLAKLRNNDNTVAKTQGLLERVNKVSEVLMAPIGKVDRFVICRLFGACQAQVEKNGGAKVGTEENKIAAGKLLREVILETQQNSAATEKSAAMRSGSEILRTVTMFSADSMKVLGRVIDSVGEVSVLKAKLRQKGLDSEARATLESDLKEAHRKARKSVGALMLSALYMVGIAQFFKFLYAKEDDEENKAASLVTDFVGNLFGGLPVLRDVVSFFTEGYEVDNYAYSSLNDLLSSSKSLFDAFGDIVSGKASSQDIAAGTKRMLYSVGQLFGLPVRNVYNVAYGLTKRFSPETAYKIDMVFYKKNFQNDLKKAVEKGDEDMVNLIMGILYGERISEAVPEAVHGELYALSLAGHKVIPRSIPSTITYNDEERALTEEEREAIKKVYSASLSSLEKLFTKPTYGKLTEEQKVEAINYVYDTYYKTALKGTLGIDRLSNAQRTADVVGAETLALLHIATKDLESDLDRNGNTISGSKRKKVLAAINSLGLSIEKKLLLICMKGYSIKDGDIRGMSAEKAKRYLLKYILSMRGKTQAEKAELAELCGFTVRNGRIVIKTAS